MTRRRSESARVFVREVNGVPTRVSVDPEEYIHSVLAADLADPFLLVCQEARGAGLPLQNAVKAFLRHMDSQPHPAGRFLSIGDLRVRHINTWEMEMLDRQRADRTDTAYRNVVYLLALLRRIEDDNPGTLDADLVRRLESTTRLSHIRRPGEPAFETRDVQALRGEAHRQVYRAHAPIRTGVGDPTMTPEVAIALHVLWSLGTGEPPEVVRAVKMQDIVASTNSHGDEIVDGMTPSERLHFLAQNDLVDVYAVTFQKARAGQRYERVYTRHHRAAHRAITATLVLGQALRTQLGTTALWVTEYPQSGPARTDWSRRKFSGWVAAHLADRGISQPHVYRRLRKVVTTREALADPVRYLRDGRRHTARTFFDHYTNSTVLRAHAGRVLVDAINETFDDAVNGPTVILPDAEALLVAGATTESLDSPTFNSLEAGELETTMAACRDPLTSPHSPKGHPCAVSGTGDCFACPNALILRRHLPAALRLAELTDPARAAKVEVWEDRWRPVYEAVTQVVLPVFSAEDIAAARPDAAGVLLDPTLLNDLGGVE